MNVQVIEFFALFVPVIKISFLMDIWSKVKVKDNKQRQANTNFVPVECSDKTGHQTLVFLSNCSDM